MKPQPSAARAQSAIAGPGAPSYVAPVQSQKPRRLRPRRILFPPRGLDYRDHMREAEADAERQFLSSRRLNAVRAFRAARRCVALVLWTLIAVAIQSVCFLVPGRARIRFARIYHRVLCWLMAIDVRAIGTQAESPGRPVVFVSNHASWLDIPVLGSRLEACFIAKAEVGSWPVIRTVAKLGRTVFVSRKRGDTRSERDEMRARLTAGDSLILFPEGTTSDGGRVLPFRSAFFSIAEGENPPLVQPVSIVFDQLSGLPVGRRWRPLHAWYGDMDIGTHTWRYLQHHRSRVTVVLHPPLDPRDFRDRKALASAAFAAVDAGCATLRQNRPVVLPAPTVTQPQPAFA